jgi:inner membrane protein
MGEAHGRTPALISFAAICAYILVNGLVTARAEQLTADAVQKKFNLVPTLVVANPMPVQFWKREMLWRDGRVYGQGNYTAFNDIMIDDSVRAHNMPISDQNGFESHIARGAPLVFWSRMPVAQIVDKDNNRALKISDQRFTNPLVGDRFSAFFPIGDESK